MPLSDKPTHWADEIAASSDVLIDAASVPVARHHLSTAVSRKPQRALWEAAKPHVGTMLTAAAGCGILRCLGEFGTPATLADLATVLMEHAAILAESNDAAQVVDSLAPRVDETTGKREALFKALLSGATPAKLARSQPLRTCIARLTGDKAFGSTVSKLVSDKAFVQWLTTAICDKKVDDANLNFVEKILASSAANAATSAVVTAAVLQSVKQQLEAQAEHRPRPVVLKALCQHGHPETLDKLCAAVAQWKNLEHVVLGADAKNLSHLLERAASVAPRTKLASAVLKVVPAEKLAVHSFATGKLLLALRDTKLVPLGSESSNIVDAVEDRITCATASCAEATKAAIRRELERRGPAEPQRRPKIAVVDSDDEEATPARKSNRAEKGPTSASKRGAKTAQR